MALTKPDTHDRASAHVGGLGSAVVVVSGRDRVWGVAFVLAVR